MEKLEQKRPLNHIALPFPNNPQMYPDTKK